MKEDCKTIMIRKVERKIGELDMLRKRVDELLRHCEIQMTLKKVKLLIRRHVIVSSNDFKFYK